MLGVGKSSGLFLGRGKERKKRIDFFVVSVTSTRGKHLGKIIYIA